MGEGHAAVREGTRQLTYVLAVNEAMRWGLATYPEALLFGEDVAIPGGPYGASRRLHSEFGARVFDTPISETAMLGAGVGAAMRGMRPIVEIMFSDFFLVALDQMVNQAANVRYTSRGRYSCPLTVRSQQAATPGACRQHTHSFEAFFAHVPGLYVGLPSTARDAYEMLRTAIATDDPVVLLESRALYQEKQEFVLDDPVEAIGGARSLHSGDDLTLITWGRMTRDAVTAAERLHDEGVEVDVIDLRRLAPLDFDAVAKSVESTGRVVIAHEANVTGGFGAELAARIAGELFWHLDAPIARVGAGDVPLPAAPVLQASLLPSADAIVDAARRVVDPA